MKNKIIISIIISITIIAMVNVSAYAYTISKSITATDLDEMFESDITISTPINDGSNFYDFVFVLDKSTSGDSKTREAIKQFEKNLKFNNKNIKIGVVAFYNKAEIVKTFDETDIKNVSGSGTNLPAGILLGTKMLDDDTTVLNSHKYLIIISDGDTHIFNKNNTLDGEPTVIAQSNSINNSTKIAGPASYQNKYSNSFNPPGDWKKYFEDIKTMVEYDKDKYENPWNTKGNNKYNDTDKYIPYDEIQNHAVSVDKSLYYSYINYLSAQEKGYKTYTVPLDSNYGRIYGKSFLEFLNNGNDISVDSLIDIINMVGPGTTITNYIGKGINIQGIDYDFDVVDDINNYVLKINGVKKDITKIESKNGATSTYGVSLNADNKYDYIINYYSDSDNERVEIVYNVSVTSVEPIEVKFKIKLTNPTDIDGDYTGLDTTNNCIMRIMDNNGNYVGDEIFEKPKLKYSVKPKETPQTPDSPKNNTNEIKNDTVEKEEQITNIVNNNVEQIVDETSSKNTITIDSIPKTGDNIVIVRIILIVSIILFIGTIIYEKNVTKRKPKH